MQTLARAAVRSGRTGQPLPDVWPTLAEDGVQFRRAGTAMIAGAPGSYKSTIALNLACKWADEGMTILYVSADSDQFTVAKRCAAILSGDSTKKVEHSLKEGGYATVLRRLSSVHFEFRPLDMAALDLRLRAFEQLYGHLPDLIVLDNLMNCVDSPADFHGQIEMTRDLDAMATATGAHILILHHTSEQYQGTEPPPRWYIQGKVTQFPRLVLTVASEPAEPGQLDLLKIACVKNTNGPQQADGKRYTQFFVDPLTLRISEIRRG